VGLEWFGGNFKVRVWGRQRVGFEMLRISMNEKTKLHRMKW